METNTVSYSAVDDSDQEMGKESLERLRVEDVGKESLDCLVIQDGETQPSPSSEDWIQQQFHRSLDNGNKNKKRWLRLLAIVVPLLLVAGGIVGLLVQIFYSKAQTVKVVAKTDIEQPKQPKVAFATLLSMPANEAAKETNIDDDNYFVATRLLGYQLLHDPVTKNKIGADVIVIVTPTVSQAKIDRLERDGLKIYRGNFTDPALYPYNSHQYNGVWNKLHVWQMTQYDRVIFLDNDHVLNKPLDSILHQTELHLCQNKGLDAGIAPDEAPQPAEYAFAISSEIGAHDYPPKEDQYHEGEYGGHYANAGFFVAKPDIKMWDYFMSVLKTPNKFNPVYAEQNLLNYVFRPIGNMPRKMLDIKWSAHRPSMSDVVGGAHAVHEKFWSTENYNKDLLEYLRSWRWRMEGFYTAWDSYVTH